MSRIKTPMVVDSAQRLPGTDKMRVDLESGDREQGCTIVVFMTHAAEFKIGSSVRLVIETGEDATR